MPSSNLNLSVDYPFGESPRKLVSSTEASSSNDSSVAPKAEVPRPAKKIAGTPIKKAKSMPLAPPMGFTPSPSGPPPPPPARSQDTRDKNKSSFANSTLTRRRLHLGTGSNKKTTTPTRLNNLPPSRTRTHPVLGYANEASVMAEATIDTSCVSNMDNLPSNLNADDIASIIAVQSIARRWKVKKETSPTTASSGDNTASSPIVSHLMDTDAPITVTDVDLSHLVDVFDKDINDAAASVKAKQANAEEMAKKRRQFVEQAMKNRFADNSEELVVDDSICAGTSLNKTTCSTDKSIYVEREKDVKESNAFGTPESKKRPEELHSNDTPDSCPSVPSVGLSQMMDDYNSGGSRSHNNGSTITTSPSPNKSTNTLQSKHTLMYASYCNVSAMSIPEHNVFEHHHHDITPTKKFNDMLSMCEEYDSEEENDTGSNISMSTTTSRVTCSQIRAKKMTSAKSACDESADLSAMYDLVMNSQVTDDTSLDMCAARAAVQNESVYDSSLPAQLFQIQAMDTSTSSCDINAHESASELDMRGVSIFNHSTDNLLKADHAKSDNGNNYSYPPASSSGSPCGSSMPAADSYDSYDYGVGKSTDKSAFSDATSDSTRGKRLFSSKICLIVSTPIMIGIIGALIWYAFFAPKGWFNSNEVESSIGGTTVLGDTENDGVFGDISLRTESPTAMPTWGIDFDFDPEFMPRPTPAPTPKPTIKPTNGVPVSRPTKPAARPTPASFRGHETFSFYVIGDVPYTAAEEAIVEHQIRNMAVEAVPYLDNEGAQFVVHVGDIMKGGKRADCSKWRYELIEDFYKDYCPVRE